MSVLRRWRFAALVFFAYAWLFPWLPELRSPNEISRLLQARAAIDYGTLSLNQEMDLHGGVGDLSVFEGRYFPNKAPGVSIAGAPVYGLVRLLRGAADKVPERTGIFFLRLFVCMLPAAIAAELLRRILAERLSPELAYGGATVFALGTLMWPYSTLLMSHGPTAVALVACWWALAKARVLPPEARPDRLYALAGLMAGTAVLIEYTGALMLPPLFLYGLATARHKPRAFLFAALGAVLPIAALALYHWNAYGNPLHTGYRHLVNPTFAEWHARGFMGVGPPSGRALVGSFFDPARGLFVYAPFLALGVPGLWTLWKQDRADALLCGSALLLYALFTAGFVYEAWGWSVGPRHITPLCAFLALPATSFAGFLRERRLGIVPAALAGYGIVTMAMIVAICPYFPEELTSPLHQLVWPLGRDGHRGHDLLTMLLGTTSAWTLVPWLSLFLLPLLRRAVGAFLAGGSLARRRVELALACLLGLGLWFGLGAAGGEDRFEGTRKFIVEKFDPRPGHAAGLFDPP